MRLPRYWIVPYLVESIVNQKNARPKSTPPPSNRGMARWVLVPRYAPPSLHPQRSSLCKRAWRAILIRHQKSRQQQQTVLAILCPTKVRVRDVPCLGIVGHTNTHHVQKNTTKHHGPLSGRQGLRWGTRRGTPVVLSYYLVRMPQHRTIWFILM